MRKLIALTVSAFSQSQRAAFLFTVVTVYAVPTFSFAEGLHELEELRTYGLVAVDDKPQVKLPEDCVFKPDDKFACDAVGITCNDDTGKIEEAARKLAKKYCEALGKIYVENDDGIVCEELSDVEIGGLQCREYLCTTTGKCVERKN